MSRVIRAVAPLVATLVLVPLAPAAIAGGSVVSVTDSAFVADVSNLPRPGYAVPWEWSDVVFALNVRQDDGLFRSGDPTSAVGTQYERPFSAGTFHYYCEVHGSPAGGMDGVVRVPVFIQPTGVIDVMTVTWAEVTRTGKAFDLQYRIDGGAWTTWRTDTAKLAARFGRDDKPVPIEEGHDYEIRARSQKRADTPAKVSGWSPPEGFQLA